MHHFLLKMLRSKGLITPSYINVSKRLISKEVRQVLNTRLDSPDETNGNQIQLAVVSKNLNALNLDLFVNNLSQFEDRRSTILDLLTNLRTSKLANTCLESTHFAVVRHLLENSTIQEVVPILADRQQYGIFLNNFTGFAVMETLHNEKEYVLGLQLVLKLVLLDELTSVFVQAFCVKSIIESLKYDLLSDTLKDDKSTAILKGKIQEKKVRVKFLRNEHDIQPNHEMGKAILKIASKILKDSARDNALILGYALSENYSELEKIINTGAIEINEDIGEICKELFSRANKSEFLIKVEKMATKQSFLKFIDGLLENAAVGEASKLAEKQMELLAIWQEIRQKSKSDVEKEISTKERIENIERTKSEISNKKELLWFFNYEDKIDLEIYNKRVYYPKRWFGKKKKPRIVDEHYVPPQIRRIN
ncbi:hypothetical protein DOY81_004469 [Sarcophaga bullata]|nr:hypothetical protein DOY81_004469 [Sarcophaga bullata]